MLVRREAPRIPEANWCLSAFGMRLGKRSQDMALECIDLPCELPFISIGAASQRMSSSAGSRRAMASLSSCRTSRLRLCAMAVAMLPRCSMLPGGR